MRRALSTTLSVLPVGLLLLTLTVSAAAQGPGDYGPPPPPVPNLNGTWYLNGDPDKPCQISQRRLDGRALFTNEHGSEAWGTVRGDRVRIPDWSDGSSQGLSGRIRGDRILWPGSYWSR
jgi:hypothetical protein